MYGATECKRRHCQVWFTDNPAPCHPPQESPESSKGEATAEDLELGELPELEPGVTSFLRGSAESSEEEGPPPELPVWELHEWMTWKAKMTETPDWWRELLAVPGVPNGKRLVQTIQALFSHPKRASEVKKMKDHCEAPPAPLCLLRKSFQLPPDNIFACQDIREIWRENTIAYTHALQYGVEKSDLPTGGQPCWLVKSVKELWEELKCYLSFSDREVFEGVTALEGMPSCLVEEAEPLAWWLHLPPPPENKLSRRPHRNQSRGGSALNSPDGQKCCMHPSL